MKKILILGSLPKDEKRHKLYTTIISICKKYGEEILTPIDTANFNGTDSQRYNRAFKTVKWADFIIGEQSEPSTGQGMEIRESTILEKPLLVIAKINSKVSGLVKGSSNLKNIIYYDNLKDLEFKLDEFLNQNFN